METPVERPPLTIRPFTEPDWPAVWAILQPVFQAGDTLAFAPDTSEAAAHQAWVEAPPWKFVACGSDGEVLGVSFIKPNQPGLGDHVCNAGYVTSPAARGLGVASALCAHSLDEARALGFRAMQYNLVIATNEVAVRLWRKHGFDIVGTLPGAFRHARLGPVDAHVMFKSL